MYFINSKLCFNRCNTRKAKGRLYKTIVEVNAVYGAEVREIKGNTDGRKHNGDDLLWSWGLTKSDRPKCRMRAVVDVVIETIEGK